MTITLYPKERSDLVFTLSRATFAENLASQKARLRVGVVVRAQPG
jgi:hypothetical protein